MWRGAFKIKAVARLQPIVLAFVQPDFKVTAKNMKELLSLVRVGLPAAAAGFDAKEVRLHRRIPPGQQFHADTRRGFQNFSLGRADKTRIIALRLEEGKYVGAVEARDAAKRGDRRAHLAALECTEKTNRNARGLGDLRKGKAAPGAQSPKTLPRGERALGGQGNYTLVLEDMNDGGRIEAAGTPKKNGTLQQAHVGFAIEPVTALCPPRRDQS